MFNDYSRRRDADLAAARERQAVIDQERIRKTEEIFRSQLGLIEAIKTNIMPALVSVRTKDGSIGSGFFQHSLWFVSNAHVFPDWESLQDAVLVRHDSTEEALKIKRSFHRPLNPDSPDLVIIETQVDSKCLPAIRTGDGCHDQRYYFYIDIHTGSFEDSKIKFLKPHSGLGVYPMIYSCTDDVDPQRGSSGSPIIEARLTSAVEGTPTWLFFVVGVLYGRCSAEWLLRFHPEIPEEISATNSLVCAIPAIEDFHQILDILHEETFEDRAVQMARYSRVLKDEARARMYDAEGKASLESKELQLEQFRAGMTKLNIELPLGLEKLIISDEIIPLSRSMLLEDNLRRLARRRDGRYRSCTLDELETDFGAFIREIRARDLIYLGKEDRSLLSPGKFLRIDIQPSKKSCKRDAHWKLDIQDNTNNRKTSSVFAIVNLPIDLSEVRGVSLAHFFEESKTSGKPRDVDLDPPEAAYANTH